MTPEATAPGLLLPLAEGRNGDEASLSEVGGKAQSLIRLATAGFVVPPGVVLTRAFFAPWYAAIQSSPTWTELTTAANDQWPALCARLQEQAGRLSLDEAQTEALDRACIDLEAMTHQGGQGLLAVRSSSPQEDLDGASFAGGYESRLGVRPADLADAIRHCFASSLDHRLWVYKQQQGFDPFAPSIAVIVQQQIDATVAGVGFSLDPLSNDFDHAVFDANWGLGETVVGGLATPDHFVVDKVTRQVIERSLGAKQIAHHLDAAGGVLQQDAVRQESSQDMFCLDDDQLAQLTALICQVEELYGQPVDIEWAFDAEQLHLLQARPITTFVPLAPEMLTQPGERRRVYMDLALSSGLTINAPISLLGLDWMQQVLRHLFAPFVGALDFPSERRRAMWFFAGHRMYADYSNLLWTAGPETQAKGFRDSDALMAEILANVDVARYRAERRPRWVSWRLILLIPRMLWAARGLIATSAASLLMPRRMHARYVQDIEAYRQDLQAFVDSPLPFAELRQQLGQLMGKRLFHHTMPALVTYLAALASVDRVVGKDSEERSQLAGRLKLGFEGNVVSDMGLALQRLARLAESEWFENLPQLAERLTQRRLPTEFLEAWDDFVANYGTRGPMEMDIASPRYANQPTMALRQMSFMVGGEPELDVAANHRQQVHQRRAAYAELISRSGVLRRWLLRRIHTMLELFGGSRDTPKHQLLQAFLIVRRRAVQEGQRWVDEDRLDQAEHIFDLTFEDLETAAQDPTYDLRRVRSQRTSFLKQLKSRVKAFPPVIDSRGRILRPPQRAETPGELRGMAIATGCATGPVKVLHEPDEKEIEPGDVLVAYTTDPGWTPLFVNAAAIILEVGGVLQHGAVVAREYGKPCVAGIDRVTSRLKDGQIVEVDGSAGVVKLVS